MLHLRCSVEFAIRCQSTEYGALGRSRTCDPLVRSQVLYPAELRARVVNLKQVSSERARTIEKLAAQVNL